MPRLIAAFLIVDLMAFPLQMVSFLIGGSSQKIASPALQENKCYQPPNGHQKQ
jgi:hypothetical protein